MQKSPIAIEPTDPNEPMLPTSRLRLGKTYSIECNVKVRDIGKVAPEDRTKLLRYHQDERDIGFEPDDLDDNRPQNTFPPAQSAKWPGYQGSQGFYGYRSQQGY